MKRVLVVEDERDVAQLVVDALTLDGYEARAAAGEKAVEEARSWRPSVVLLDLMMPVVDGFEVAKRLHTYPETTSMPIVVMTAMGNAAERAAQIGTKHVLSKPFDLDDLLTTVRRAGSEAAA